jgi:hypothetical protein
MCCIAISEAYFMASAASQTKCCFHRPYFDKAIIRTSNDITPGAIKSSCRNRKSVNNLTAAKRETSRWIIMMDWIRTTKGQKTDVAFVEDTIGKQ